MLKNYIAAALISCMAASASAELKYEFRYDHSNKTCVVIGHTGEVSPSYPESYVPLGIGGVNGSEDTYTVIGIEPGALNDISGLKILHLPNTLEYIGWLRVGQTGVKNGADLKNFINCPDLEKFIVADGSPILKSTGAGILTSLDGTQVYRVPAKIDVSANNGNLKMSTTGVAIGPDCFDSNSSIKTLTFSKNLEYIHRSPGFSSMKSLQSFIIPSGGTGTSVFTVDGAALIEKSKKLLRFYAPAAIAPTYTIKASLVETVDNYAFENTITLKDLTVEEGVKTFKDYAFRNSSLVFVHLPSSLNFTTNGGVGAFQGSRISKLDWNTTTSTMIPKDFMRDCQYLRDFICTNPPSHIGGCAFKDCYQLQNFKPFDGNTRLYGDSTFANTGFTEVIYQESERNLRNAMEFFSTFAGCKLLKKIDMRNFYVPNSSPRILVGENFASGCPKLEEVYFPGYTEFQKNCFVNTPLLKKIWISEFDIPESPAILFDTNTILMPEFFVMVPENGAGFFNIPVDRLFQNAGNGVVTSQFYFETIYPLFGSYAPGSVNYIPGNMLERYPVPTNGAIVYEMFDWSVQQDGEQGEITITFDPLEFVELQKLTLKGGFEFDIPESGILKLPGSQKGLEQMKLNYTAKGVPMEALYPSNLQPWVHDTGLGTLSSTPQLSYDGKCIRTFEGAHIAIFDLQGRKVIDSNEKTIYLDGLEAGCYTAVCDSDTFCRTLKFVIR